MDRGISSTNRDLFELTEKNGKNHLGQEIPSDLLGNKSWLGEKKNEKVVLSRTHGIADQRVKPNQFQKYLEQAKDIVALLQNNYLTLK